MGVEAGHRKLGVGWGEEKEKKQMARRISLVKSHIEQNIVFHGHTPFFAAVFLFRNFFSILFFRKSHTD